MDKDKLYEKNSVREDTAARIRRLQAAARQQEQDSANNTPEADSSRGTGLLSRFHKGRKDKGAEGGKAHAFPFEKLKPAAEPAVRATASEEIPPEVAEEMQRMPEMETTGPQRVEVIEPPQVLGKPVHEENTDFEPGETVMDFAPEETADTDVKEIAVEDIQGESMAAEAVSPEPVKTENEMPAEADETATGESADYSEVQVDAATQSEMPEPEYRIDAMRAPMDFGGTVETFEDAEFTMPKIEPPPNFTPAEISFEGRVMDFGPETEEPDFTVAAVEAAVAADKAPEVKAEATAHVDEAPEVKAEAAADMDETPEVEAEAAAPADETPEIETEPEVEAPVSDEVFETEQDAEAPAADDASETEPEVEAACEPTEAQEPVTPAPIEIEEESTGVEQITLPSDFAPDEVAELAFKMPDTEDVPDFEPVETQTGFDYSDSNNGLYGDSFESQPSTYSFDRRDRPKVTTYAPYSDPEDVHILDFAPDEHSEEEQAEKTSNGGIEAIQDKFPGYRHGAYAEDDRDYTERHPSKGNFLTGIGSGIGDAMSRFIDNTDQKIDRFADNIKDRTEGRDRHQGAVPNYRQQYAVRRQMEEDATAEMPVYTDDMQGDMPAPRRRKPSKRVGFREVKEKRFSFRRPRDDDRRRR